MKGECPIYLDDQGGRQMQVLQDDVSPCILLNGAKAHALIVCERKPRVVAFAQNTRDQTTFVYTRKKKHGIKGTKERCF